MPMTRFIRLFVPIFDKLHFIMDEEEIEIVSGNKFKAARNEFRKSHKEEESEDDGNLIEEEAEDEKVSLKKEKGKQESQETTDEAPAPKRKRKAPKEKVNPFQPIINFLLYKIIFFSKLNSLGPCLFTV